MSILIKNGNIITLCDGVIENGYVYIKGNKIVSVGSQVPEDIKPEKIIDAKGKVIAPGIVNGHMHCYSTFARGISLTSSPSCFVEILEKLWWKLDKVLATEDLYYSTITVALEGIRSGITTFIDHHASPYCVTGCLDELERAFLDANLRSILCYEVSDRDGKEIANKGIEENVRFIRKANANKESILRGMMGLHASFTVDDDTLEKSVEEAKKYGVGLHLHVAEDHSDQTLTLSRNKKRVVKRLYDAGVLGEKSISAHGVWTDDEEKELLAQTKTWNMHNPRSNMNNAVGPMDLLKMFSKGVRVGLGSDGMAASLWPEIQFAALIHKHENRDPRVVWNEVETMIANNALLTGSYFDESVGVLKAGALADVVVFDYDPPTPLNSDNYLGHFLFGFAHVRANSVVINGKLVLEDNEFVMLDEQEVMAKSREQASSFWKRFAK